MFCSFCENVLLKTGNICQEMSRKIMYARTDVGGRVKLKAYFRVQDWWFGHECGDFGSTYFLDDL